MEALADAPAAALADVEAWEAREAYPDVLSGGGPVFGVAEELETGGWRIISLFGNSAPQGSRDAMAMIFRERARDAGEAGDTGAQREWLRMAERLDWEAVNELTVLGRRFRGGSGPDGPEGPRPSDHDPELPTAVQEKQLREQGLLDEDRELSEEEAEQRRVAEEQAKEFLRLFEEQRRRRAAAEDS